MKKNGFTLIEVLGVIAVLALISTIVLITVDKSLKDSKNTLSSIQLENIKSAANMWKADNIESIPDTGYYTITLGDLIDSGYTKDVIDINTNSNYDRNIIINIGMNEILIDTEQD